jgi:hypothetical protein
VSLEGVLSDFGVGEIFQLISQQRKTGRLEIRTPEAAFEVYFAMGDVVRARPAAATSDGALGAFLLRTGVVSDATLGEAARLHEETLEALERVLVEHEHIREKDLEELAHLLSDETIFELFLCDEGHFAFKAAERIEPAIGDRAQGAEGVLLDALRMRDEWDRIRDVLPDFSGTLALARTGDPTAEELARLQEASGCPAAACARLHALIDGRLTVRRVIDLSRLGTFSAGRAIVALIGCGFARIERKQAALAERGQRASPEWRPHVLLALPAVAIIAGLALLLDFGPAAVVRTELSALGDATRAAEAERVRAALEAHRWAAGTYPESLAELVDAGGPLLAGVPLAHYSYRRLGREYALDRLAGPASAFAPLEQGDDTRGSPDRQPEGSGDAPADTVETAMDGQPDRRARGAARVTAPVAGAWIVERVAP